MIGAMPLTPTAQSSDSETQVIPAVGADPTPRRRYLRKMVPAVLVAGIAAAAGVVWFAGAGGTPPPANGEPVGVETIALVKQDISTSQSLTGRLGYGAAQMLKGGKEGTVTWLPMPGMSIKRGQQLYRVDDRPVSLFYGGIPLYRPLKNPDMVGRDVRVVADNLKTLGYDVGDQPRPGTRLSKSPRSPSPKSSPEVTVQKGEGVLTTALRAAVKRWQKDLHVPETGTIEPGDVVVLVGAVRIDSVAVLPGENASAPLMSVTQTTKAISLEMEVGDASSVEQGDPATVHLPDESTVSGKVTAIGTAVKPAEENGGSSNAVPKVTVTVAVDKPDTIAKIDAAEVQVDFAAETHKGVLVAPVGALLALNEGGYAVQLEGGALVAVDTGIFAKGLVEIKGNGLVEGTRVVTTS
ncbi:efflux RND transporter periplasmic adaptor subunit [Micromonospora sp. NPDC007208]|uniref:efflux RND transporter periplasmic adaptor subunit n=1 Tax=Micromonospora sp. NPDC007208 TaxID=3364236 RepID=UPI0036875264